MAYDEKIETRIKKVSGWKNTGDKKMFGGVCHLLNGNMFCGVHKEFLILPLGADTAEDALKLPHVRPFDITGRPMKLIYIFFACLLLMETAVFAGQADVVAAKVTRTDDDTYKFDVTVRHTDEGWKHYADKWDVTAHDGTVLGTRILAHPHVDEQPFTRSLVGVKIPDNIDKVTVRAHDLVHGYGGKTVEVAVPGK